MRRLLAQRRVDALRTEVSPRHLNALGCSGKQLVRQVRAAWPNVTIGIAGGDYETISGMKQLWTHERSGHGAFELSARCRCLYTHGFTPYGRSRARGASKKQRRLLSVSERCKCAYTYAVYTALRRRFTNGRLWSCYGVFCCPPPTEIFMQEYPGDQCLCGWQLPIRPYGRREQIFTLFF